MAALHLILFTDMKLKFGLLVFERQSEHMLQKQIGSATLTYWPSVIFKIDQHDYTAVISQHKILV